VTSRATPRFWAAYRDLPPEIKEAARKAYRLFRDNARHRALGLLDDDEIAWFWIGPHAAYDRLLEGL
jgi:hypothetical protein